MRLFVVCGVLALLTLAGCAETPASIDGSLHDGGEGGAADGHGNEGVDGDGPVDEAITGLTGNLVVALDNTTVLAGIPFNVTLHYESDNGTDASTLSWSVAFVNETGESMAYNGTGLPAAFEANLTMLGNVTLTGNATGEAGAATFEAILMFVELAEVAPVDPCIGAVVQDAITIKGSNLAPGGSSDHPFEVLPCQTKLSATIAMAGGSIDNDWWLYTPSGAEVGAGTSFGIRTENAISVSSADKLAPGTWKFTVDNFLGAAADYTITVTFS